MQLSKYIIIVFLIFNGVNAFGITYTFTSNGVDDSWTNVANWDSYPGLTLSAGDTVTIDASICKIPVMTAVEIGGVLILIKSFEGSNPKLIIGGNLKITVTGKVETLVHNIARIDVSPSGHLENYSTIECNINITKGKLSGNGTFINTTCSACELLPGGAGAIGTLEFTGKLSFRNINTVEEFIPDHAIYIDIESESSFDKIVTADFKDSPLGDTIFLNLINNYQPTLNDLQDFKIIETGEGKIDYPKLLNYADTIPIHWQLSFSEDQKFLSLEEIAEYKFDYVDGGNSDYTNPINWLDDADYNGYPGTTIDSNEVVLIGSVATCEILPGVHIDVRGKLDAFEIHNHGTIDLYPDNFNPNTSISNDNNPSISWLVNWNDGVINVNGYLEVSNQLVNHGVININNGLMHCRDRQIPSYNYGVINVMGEGSKLELGSVISKGFENQGTLNVQGGCLKMLDELYFQNQGTLNIGFGSSSSGFEITNLGGTIDSGLGSVISNRISGNGTVSGFGIFKTLDCDGCLVLPGGANKTGFMRFADSLISDGNIKIISEIASTSEFDRIQVDDYMHLQSPDTIHVRTIGNLPQGECFDVELISYTDSKDSLFSKEILPNINYVDQELEFSNEGIRYVANPYDQNDNALDFSLTNDNQNSYATINHSLGTVKTIEFRFLPEIVDPTMSGGMPFHFKSVPNQFVEYIIQGNFTSSIPDETLSLLNGGQNIYIKENFEHRWYHVTITSSDMNGTTYDKIYLDGQAVDVYKGSAFPDFFNMNDFDIGARIGTQFSVSNFKGRLDEIRLWSDVRTPSEIQANWNQELSSDDYNDLKAYYKMNQGLSFQNNSCVDFLIDESGNGYHGELMDFDLNGNNHNWVRVDACPSYISKVNNAFNGEGDGSSWFDIDNWELDEIPTTCHHAIIPNGFDVEVDGVGALCYTLDVQGSINTNAVTTLESYAPRQ